MSASRARGEGVRVEDRHFEQDGRDAERVGAIPSDWAHYYY
jgi:hypothetical protein